MTTITHEGQEYTIVADGSDFELQGLHDTLVIVGGYDQLKAQCEKALREELRYADEINPDYNFESDLEDFVDEKTIDFVKRNISKAKILKNNLN